MKTTRFFAVLSLVLGGTLLALPTTASASHRLDWTRQLGTNGADFSSGVSADGLGNVYISGETFGSLGGTHAGGRDAFIVKFSDPIPEPTTLALVDIKPGSDSNPININNGVLPVAILGTEDFDVTVVDIDSLLFGDPLLIDEGGSPVSPLRSAFEDVSDDGFLDLSLKFSVAEMSDNVVLGPDTLEGLLTGALLDGTPFAGMDSIRIVPPNGSNGNSLQVNSVPEPTTCTLALAALCLAIGRRPQNPCDPTCVLVDWGQFE